MQRYQRHQDHRLQSGKAAKESISDLGANSDSDSNAIFDDSSPTTSKDSAITTLGATLDHYDEQQEELYTRKNLSEFIWYAAFGTRLDI